MLLALKEIRILLPNNQRQHRTSHAPKDVLPLRTCANYGAPCQPLLRDFSEWIRSPTSQPLNGGGVEFDSREVLGRSQGPAVGCMSLVSTQGMPTGVSNFQENAPP